MPPLPREMTGTEAARLQKAFYEGFACQYREEFIAAFERQRVALAVQDELARAT